MISSRKSTSNLLQTVEGPFLIHFRYWFETKIRQLNSVKIQFGKRPFTQIQNSSPTDRYIILDIASRSTMPICQIQSAEGKASLDLKKYQPGLHKQYFITVGKVKFGFAFQLLSTTVDIYAIYCSEKVNNDQKIRYTQSINDLVRSEAEFIAKFQKDLQLQQFNNHDQMQSDIQTKLSNQLVSIKPLQINFKIIITLFILFLFIGYLVASPEQPRRRNKKKGKKAKK